MGYKNKLLIPKRKLGSINKIDIKSGHLIKADESEHQKVKIGVLLKELHPSSSMYK
jgi:hypothetical protein